jgi:electron transport complex protein RnfG
MLKDAIILFLITLISGLALGYVYEITKEPIKQREIEDKLAAYQLVFPEAESLTTEETLTALGTQTDLTSLNAEYNGITIDEITAAYKSNNEMSGYIIKVTTNQGYKDLITLAIGYSTAGVITGVETLAINETAGLGQLADEPEFKDQFKDKNVEQFSVVKTGASSDDQIDAISGATITSRAVVNAVNAGIDFLTENASEFGGGANE